MLDNLSPNYNNPAVGKSDEFSAPDRRARVRGSPGLTLTGMLIAPVAYKVRRGCNVLYVPVQIIPLGVPKRESHPLRGGLKL